MHFSSPAMSPENQEAHSSSVLPFRDGALGPAQIRDQCPQFRILIIGKANAGKTTILRKVCNASPDAKPIIYDAEGKVCFESWHELKQTLEPYDSHGPSRSRRSSFFEGGRGFREIYSNLLLRLSEPKTVHNCHWWFVSEEHIILNISSLMLAVTSSFMIPAGSKQDQKVNWRSWRSLSRNENSLLT
jgi:hypothetical protein